MRFIRGVGIAIGFLALTLAFIPVQWIAIKFDWAMRDWLPVRFARGLCRLMGIRIETFGRPYKERGVLLAANHSSYFDMPVLAAVIPVSFVAKSEVAKWPFFGTLSKLVRTVFVERERRSKAGEQRDRIRERLEEGGTIVLFPEGTSNDGNRVLTFKSSLLGSAVQHSQQHHPRLLRRVRRLLDRRPRAHAYPRRGRRLQRGGEGRRRAVDRAPLPVLLGAAVPALTTVK